MKALFKCKKNEGTFPFFVGLVVFGIGVYFNITSPNTMAWVPAFFGGAFDMLMSLHAVVLGEES